MANKMALQLLENHEIYMKKTHMKKTHIEKKHKKNHIYEENLKEEPRAYWGFRNYRYNGKNSEGNRFIKNEDL